MRRATFLAALGAMLVVGSSCSSRPPQPSAAVPGTRPSVPSSSAPLAAKRGPSIESAVDAIDSGDLTTADELLRQIFRERGSANALLDAVHRLEGRGGQSPALLANVPARAVPRPPFEPPARSGPVKPALQMRVASRAKTEAEPVVDVLSALGDPLYATRGGRGRAEMTAGRANPPALPATYAGVPLVMALPQRDGRWLLLYGKDIGEARFVALVDARPPTAATPNVQVFDFASFIQPPDTIAPRETREAITWAALEGNVLYVANAHSGNPEASHGKNAYVTAIDLEKNAVLWRSDGNVANGGSFVVTDGHVICAYEDYDYMRLFALDRATGKTVAALPLQVPARAIWVKGGKLRARALDEELTFTGIPGLRADISAEAPLPQLAPVRKLPPLAVAPAAREKRAAALAKLDSSRPFEAAKLLRALVETDGAAGNFVVETLLDTAEKSLEASRASAAEVVLRAGVVTVVKAANNRIAPTKRVPALRLKKVSEAKDLPVRGPSIFDERHVEPADIDKPYPGHAGDLPEYVPARLGTKLLFDARYVSSGKSLLGIYSGTTVLFDVDARAPEVRFDFTPLGGSAEWPQVSRLEVLGNVVIAAVAGTSAWLTAFDRKTGEPFWTTALPVGDMLLIDGWIVATTSPQTPGGRGTDIVVVDSTTGVVASRVSTVRADRIARQGEEIIGGGPTSRVVLAITRE